MAPQQPRPMEHCQATVWILTHFDPRLDVVSADPAFRQLEPDTLIGEGVVARHDPLLLDAQDLSKVCRIDSDEGTLGELRRPGEAGIMVGQIDLADEAVGGFDKPCRQASAPSPNDPGECRTCVPSARALPASRRQCAQCQADRAPGPPGSSALCRSPRRPWE